MAIRPRNFGIVGLGYLLAGVIVTAAIALFFNPFFTSRKPFITSQPQQPASRAVPPTPTTVVNETDSTTGWKIYNAYQYATKYGSAYDFSIKYLPGWRPREHDSGTSFDLAFLSPDYQTPQTGFVEEVLGGARIEMLVIPNQKFSSLEDWFAVYYYDPRLHSTPVKPQVVSIDSGIQGLEYEHKRAEGLSHTKLFAVDDSVYQFSVVSKENIGVYMPILNWMISTFTVRK